MSSKEDQIKQQIKADQEQQELLSQGIEQLRQEEQIRATTLLKKPQTGENIEQEVESHFKLNPSEVINEDWKKILADYMKQYPNSSIENNTLIFPTKQDAISFFTAQAASEPPRTFLAREINQDGTLTGHHVFSCGNGQLYNGTLNEIINQLKATLKENPDDPNVKKGLNIIERLSNPAQSYRESLQYSKDQTLDQSPVKDKSSLPNPLNTTPSME